MSGFSERELQRHFPNISKSALRLNAEAVSGVPDAEPERDKAPALDGMAKGTRQGVPGITVRFTGFRVRPLDPDNFAASVKDILDGLRHAKLIPGDEPWRITLETAQVCVRSYSQERTEIVITYA